MIHPRFFDMVSACRARHIKVSLISNGSLLGRDNVARLMELGVESIHVSLESADPSEFQAIRVGEWKLLLNRKAAARQNKVNSPEVNRRAAELAKGTGPVLFHLAKDPQELTDLSAKYPQKVKQMRALAEKRLADVKSKVIPLTK